MSTLSDIIYRFEAAYQADGGRPRLQDFVPTDGPERTRILHELAQVDLEYRRRLGLPVRVDDYVTPFPELAAHEDLLIALIETEHQQRRERGERLLLDEYTRRFPAIAQKLADPLQTQPDAPEPTPPFPGPVPTPARMDRVKLTPPAALFPRGLDPDAVPPEVPGHELTGEVKFGGMGAVYFGTEAALGRPVAVKVLRRRLASDPRRVAHFQAEAQICAQLQHPGIVPVYQVGQLVDERPFYTMKRVKGDTLSELLKKRSSPAADLPQFLSHFRGICEAMAYAHARNVLHRDLKPANVMVGKFGEVLLMDWGLAKLLGESSTESSDPEPPSRWITLENTDQDHLGTAPGGMVGTPDYMPPEQAGGRLHEVDKRSDVFGLGTILCCILTGQPPYVGPTLPDILAQAISGDLSVAEALLAVCQADPELIELTRKCLAPKREDRPADAGVVARAITAYLAGVEERLRKAELERRAAEVRAVEERKRRRLIATLAVVGVAALVVIAFCLRWVERTQAAVRAQTAVQVNQELGRAKSLRDEAVRIPLTDPNQRQESERTWREILALADKAEEIVATAPADAETQRTVAETSEALRAEAATIARDRQMLARLEEARDQRASITDQDVENTSGATIIFGHAAADAYAAAFRDYGIDVLRLPPQDAAQQLRARPEAVRLALVAALDDWLALEKDQPVAQHLLEIACTADPDPFRNRLRVAVALRQRASLRQLAREAAGLALPIPASLLLADGLQATGELELAVAVLRRAQQAHPDDFWVNDILGVYLCVWDPSRMDEAAGYFTAALALRPESYPVYDNLGVTLGWQCRWQEARQAFETAFQRSHERFYNARLNLSSCLSAQGDLDGAIAICKEAIGKSAAPTSATHTLIGEMLLAGRKEEAMKLAEGLVNPERGGEHYLQQLTLGLARLANDRPEEAIAALTRALELNRDGRAALLGLAWAYQRHQDDEKTLETLGKYLALWPNDPQAHVQLAFLFAKQKNWEKAVVEGRRAVALRPAYWQFHMYLAGFLLGEDRFAYEALSVLREAHARAPDVAFARRMLASTFTRCGLALARSHDLDGAVQCQETALDLDSRNLKALEELGRLWSDLGYSDKAIFSLTRAIELGSKFSAARNNLGWAYKEKGDLENSIAWYWKAIEVDEKSIVAHANLGTALVESGCLTEGREELELALQRTPETSSQRQSRAQALEAAEALVLLEPQLQAIMKGEKQPTTFLDGLQFGKLCRVKHYYVAAVRLYEQAFTTNPEAGRKAAPVNLLVFARACLLAASGQGNDAPPEAERPQYRAKALERLRQYVAAQQTKLQKDHNGYRYTFQQEVRPLLEHQDLATVQPKALEKLPEDERVKWRRFWSEVAGLLISAEVPLKD